MGTIPTSEASYWIESTSHPAYPRIKGEVHVDLAVVGGGIAGMATAYFAKQAGLTVALLDKGRIGGRVTGNTTGKLTSQHNLCYTTIAKQFGEQPARLYGEANQDAIATIERIIIKENINCDFAHDDNYVFTEDPSAIPRFKTEATLAQKIGLPARFTTKTGLPFAVAGAVKFSGQAKFHAGKFLLGLAKVIDGNGSYIFEHSEAITAHDGHPCVVRTKNGGRITCKNIVLVTNVPFPPFTHGYYFGFVYPLKSYIVAAKLQKPLSGMYITENTKHTRSILPITVDGQDWLLVGGESHFPGFGIARSRHKKLAGYATDRFGVTHFDYRWSTWDYMSNDSVPQIGPAVAWSRRVYAATGFSKWGLTTGIVAGKILTDAVAGKQNAWAKVFTTRRLSPLASLPKAALSILKSL